MPYLYLLIYHFPFFLQDNLVSSPQTIRSNYQCQQVLLYYRIATFRWFTTTWSVKLILTLLSDFFVLSHIFFFIYFIFFSIFLFLQIFYLKKVAFKTSKLYKKFKFRHIFDLCVGDKGREEKKCGRGGKVKKDFKKDIWKRFGKNVQKQLKIN